MYVYNKSNIVQNNSIILFSVCRLLAQGIAAFLSPAASPYYSILSAYSHEYRIPFITTDLTETSWNLPTEVSLQPSTTRAILGLFQNYGWKDVVYIYDRDNGNIFLYIGQKLLLVSLRRKVEI